MTQNEILNSRERMVINSALWAAAGDALGWITELSYGKAGVKRRSGSSIIERPVAWDRVIGGRNGPKVALPAGTYSDDTQLRLAVSRCIGNGGFFDAEAFAKVELTTWPSYALGGGLGTKAAAANLARRSTAWYSNFFESGAQRYVTGGGNGAAMRIQPHVWVRESSGPELVLAVLQDALITHGHPQGFCGAVFHALTLQSTISSGSVARPEIWMDFVETFLDIPEIIDSDPQLAAFWRAEWESKTGTTLSDALRTMRDASLRDIDALHLCANSMEPGEYHRVLEVLGCTSPNFRGAGFKTALAAAFLAHVHRSDNVPEKALAQAANELESDTDTIATMAGAILGACAKDAPSWPVQDRDYIVREATRLARIAAGQSFDSFTYPDLSRWVPPANQLAAVGILDGSVVLAGLGPVKTSGVEYRSGDSIWQWCKLSFGQTVLAKRRASLSEIPSDQMASATVRYENFQNAKSENFKIEQESFRFQDSLDVLKKASKQDIVHISSVNWSLDRATDDAIKSNFDPLIVGTLFNRCLDESDSIEQVIAFAAILGKAKLARRRKNDRSK